MSHDSNQVHVLYQGRHLRLVSRAGWEFAERGSGENPLAVVGIVAVTDERELLLVEQFRLPVNRQVIELPAGLVGDSHAAQGESLESAARRELLEETGYEARTWERLFEGPSSSGLTSEMVTCFLATGLRRVPDGGAGDGTESITLHRIPLTQVRQWLKEQQRERGCVVDFRVPAALEWLSEKGLFTHEGPAR